MKTDLQLPTDTYRKLFLYAELCDQEISGLGLIRREDMLFFCDEVILVKQEVGASHTDITPDGLAETLTRIGQERPDTWGHWKLWWHSHNKMGTTFSTQDEDTLRELARVSGDWFFGLVVNKRGDSQFYVATCEPIPLFGKLEAAREWRGGTEDALVGAVMDDIEKYVTESVVKGYNPPLPTPSSSVSKTTPPNSGTQESSSGGGEAVVPNLRQDESGVVVFEGVRQDSATLGLCLMCGGATEWRPATKNRLFLACKTCVRGITNCVCPIPKVKGDPRFLILQMYWEEQNGIEAVAAAAKQLLAAPTVQDNGRKRRRSRNAGKLDSSSAE